VAPTDYQYLQGDAVLLDDVIGGSSAFITNNSVVLPAAVTNDSSTVNYTIAGSGKISGPTGLTKRGSSTLTIGTTNDFTGNVAILAGTVRINTTNALGSWSAGTVTITNGGTLDIGGWPGTSGNGNPMFGAKQFNIAGAGVGSAGALVNNGGPGQNSAFESVALTADATIGGTSRFDWRNGTPGPVLDLAGHTLTKTGANQVSMVNATVTSGNVIINQGTLSFETTSTVTNGGTITVNSGGALGHFRTSGGAITRSIVMNGGALTNLSTSGGPSTNDAPISLTADSTILHNTGSDLIFNGVISGSFGLAKFGPGNTVFNAAETYSGNTTVAAGTLTLNGSIGNSSNITVQAGATLDVSTRSDLTLTLNSGQTLAGGGTVTGKLTNSLGSVLSPGGKGVIGTLTVSSTATLKGTSYMEVTNNGTQADRLNCGTVIYGGTLVVSNLDLANPFTTNTSLQLFNAGVYAGAFTNIIPATPGTNLVWDTSNLTVNGTLKVAAGVSGPPPTPRITSVSVSGSTLNITATNGASSGSFVLLSSTNVALPFSQWTPVLTNTFDGSGNLTLSTNIVNAANRLTFYLLKQ